MSRKSDRRWLRMGWKGRSSRIRSNDKGPRYWYRTLVARWLRRDAKAQSEPA
jgi:hypothetical protein